MIELKPCPFCGRKPKTSDLHLHLHQISCKYSKCSAHPCVIKETLEEAIKAWNTRSSGWISCSERMPEDGVNVLIYSSRKEVSKAFYDSDMHRYYIADSDYSYSELDITHWMPLPEHPEGGVDDAKP